MKAIGIDLGTTNSLVAVVDDARPRVLTDGEGRALLPSVVAYEAGGAVRVGYAALEGALERPRDTILSVKRFMGRSAEEALRQGLSPYAFTQEDSVLRLKAGGEAHTPVEVSAEILRALRDRARAQVSLDVHRAVVTVPAYFDDTQRQATRQAGLLAGLDVLRLLNEPTAAALAYGLQNQAEGRFAIFDLGGGTFDISILHLVDGVFEVLSTGGDTQLGGDDFDRIVAEDALRAGGLDPIEAGPALRRQAMSAAAAAKIELTTRHEAILELTRPDGTALRSRLTRERFEALIRPVLGRVAGPCRQALSDAGLRPSQLDGVVLVGGSTRSPIVQRYVGDFFERKPLCDINPDEVVALGAAIQADLLSADSELRVIEGGDVLLLDVTPLSLGLETMGGVVEKIIPRCSQIPASRAQEFTTFMDGQTAMDIHVLQGERELVEDCRSLARFRLGGIPPKPAGAARVRVTFQVDADSILHVTAAEESTGVKQTVEVRPTYGLTDEQVETMLQASLDHAEEDVMARFLRTARVEAERLLMPLDKALSDDADLLSGEEDASIRGAAEALRVAMKRADHRRIQDLTERLDEVSAEFAQRRMERALRTGLVESQVSIDELETELANAPVGGGDHDRRPGSKESEA